MFRFTLAVVVLTSALTATLSASPARAGCSGDFAGLAYLAGLGVGTSVGAVMTFGLPALVKASDSDVSYFAGVGYASIGSLVGIGIGVPAMDAADCGLWVPAVSVASASFITTLIWGLAAVGDAEARRRGPPVAIGVGPTEDGVNLTAAWRW